MPVLPDGQRGETAGARAGAGQRRPEVSAQAANLTAGHHIPVYRVTDETPARTAGRAPVTAKPAGKFPLTTAA